MELREQCSIYDIPDRCIVWETNRKTLVILFPENQQTLKNEIRFSNEHNLLSGRLTTVVSLLLANNGIRSQMLIIYEWLFSVLCCGVEFYLNWTEITLSILFIMQSTIWEIYVYELYQLLCLIKRNSKYYLPLLMQ